MVANMRHITLFHIVGHKGCSILRAQFRTSSAHKKVSIADDSRVIGGGGSACPAQQDCASRYFQTVQNPVPLPLRSAICMRRCRELLLALGTQKDRLRPPEDRGTRFVERIDQ